MNCRQVQEYLDDLLVKSGEAPEPRLAEHLEMCPRCAQDYANAQQALAALRPSRSIRTSPEPQVLSAETFPPLQTP